MGRMAERAAALAEAAPQPTAQPAHAPATDTPPPSPTRLWDALKTTDPERTKPFTRSGGFSGTAVSPVYLIGKMTAPFGPCGLGWGMEEPRFTQAGGGGEALVFCVLAVWYLDPATGTRSAPVFGVGGETLAKRRGGNPVPDDDAWKKAYTDALGNAFKMLGMAADVHGGLFDDAKYVDSLRLAAQNDADELWATAIIEELDACTDAGAVETLAARHRATFQKVLARNRTIAQRVSDAVTTRREALAAPADPAHATAA